MYTHTALHVTNETKYRHKVNPNGAHLGGWISIESPDQLHSINVHISDPDGAMGLARALRGLAMDLIDQTHERETLKW